MSEASTGGESSQSGSGDHAPDAAAEASYATDSGQHDSASAHPADVAEDDRTRRRPSASPKRLPPFVRSIGRFARTVMASVAAILIAAYIIGRYDKFPPILARMIDSVVAGLLPSGQKPSVHFDFEQHKETRDAGRIIEIVNYTQSVRVVVLGSLAHSDATRCLVDEALADSQNDSEMARDSFNSIAENAVC